jgi:hypothetical protein
MVFSLAENFAPFSYDGVKDKTRESLGSFSLRQENPLRNNGRKVVCLKSF